MAQRAVITAKTKRKPAFMHGMRRQRGSQIVKQQRQCGANNNAVLMVIWCGGMMMTNIINSIDDNANGAKWQHDDGSDGPVVECWGQYDDGDDIIRHDDDVTDGVREWRNA